MPEREPVTFQLDGRTVHAPAGTMLVDAAAMHGVEIPIFCYEPRLGAPIGACRMCLVEVEGMRGLQTACSTPVAPDMVVRTQSEPVKQAQDGVLELFLGNHPLDCPVCDKGGECPLQDRTFRFGPGTTRFAEPKRHHPKPLDLSSLIALDRERCIACFRCVRFSQDVAQDRNLVFEERGGRTYIATASGEEYDGRFTGNVIDLCPVGALTSNPYRFVARPWDVKNAPSVCAHCSVGCNTELTAREGRILRVTGRPQPNPAVEEGWLCDKGRFAYPATFGPDRITTPLIREGGEEREVDLEEAVAYAGVLLSRGAAPGFLLGATATVEEGFLALELAARLPNGTAGRLGVPSDGLDVLRALPAAELGDIDGADLVAIVGGDPANAQPVVELRVRKAARRGARILVIGPRSTPLDGLGGRVRTEPGRLVTCIETLTDAVLGAASPVVLWDEADLANEPQAAVRLAELLAGRAGARQIELGGDASTAGLRALGIPAGLMLGQAVAQRIGTFVAVHVDPTDGPGGAEWAAALARVGPIIAIASHRSRLTDRAAVVLPALTPYEQEGVLVSMTGRAQRLRAGAPGPGGAAAGWEILVALSHRTGKPLPYRTPRQVFAAAAEAHAAFAGMSYDTIGDLGQPVARPAAPAEAPPPPAAAGDGLLVVPCPAIFGDATARRSDALAAVRTPPRAWLAQDDAERLGLNGDGLVRLASPHGEITLPAAVDPRLRPGGVFVALGADGAPGAESLLPPDRGPVRASVARA
ncbi:MAG: 2Fe-2S iron-sulfur cluster-binding protein [Actinomycetota bacterium]